MNDFKVNTGKITMETYIIKSVKQEKLRSIAP